MNITEEYLDFAISKITEVREKECENIFKAGELIAESVEKGGKLYVFGSGHSHMVAEEVYLRAGGAAFVKAILEPSLMLHEMPNKSTYLERLEGYSKVLLKLHKVDNNDTIVIASNSGRNSVAIEMALEAKKIGAKVIAIVSLKHSKSTTSRHSSGKMLYEIADIVIDNCAEKGDAVFKIEGLENPTGATSNFTSIAIVQALVTTSLDIMVKKGLNPPVFASSNVDGGDKHNDYLFDKYYGYWK